MFKLTKVEKLQELSAWLFFITMMLPESILSHVMTKDWDLRLTVVSMLLIFYIGIRNTVLCRIYDKLNKLED